MKTYRDVINSWPLHIDFAADMNLAPGLIGRWYARNSIPGGYHKKIVEIAKARRFPGITDKVLNRLAEERRFRAEREALQRKTTLEKTG